MTKDGGLLGLGEARMLSERLYPLGDHCPSIWDELDKSGYGAPARIVREAHRELAGDAEKYDQVTRYWVEYAKERLAGLVGPMDILRGRITKVSAYRSELLDRLRADAKAGRLKSEGPIVSPQIEPTIKRYIELLPDDPLRVAVKERIRAAQKTAAAAVQLRELAEFSKKSSKQKYGLLIERYLADLEPAGFTLDSHRKHGVVFRRIIANGQWAFVFVDESQDGIDGGQLFTHMAITLPKKAVLPGALPLSAAATFSPADLVPGFGAICWFDANSYAQLCLSCDANSFLAKSVSDHIDKLLSNVRVADDK
jgi:hypothetical protein